MHCVWGFCIKIKRKINCLHIVSFLETWSPWRILMRVELNFVVPSFILLINSGQIRFALRSTSRILIPEFLFLYWFALKGTGTWLYILFFFLEITLGNSSHALVWFRLEDDTQEVFFLLLLNILLSYELWHRMTVPQLWRLVNLNILYNIKTLAFLLHIHTSLYSISLSLCFFYLSVSSSHSVFLSFLSSLLSHQRTQTIAYQNINSLSYGLVVNTMNHFIFIECCVLKNVRDPGFETRAVHLVVWSDPA